MYCTITLPSSEFGFSTTACVVKIVRSKRPYFPNGTLSAVLARLNEMLLYFRLKIFLFTSFNGKEAEMNGLERKLRSLFSGSSSMRAGIFCVVISSISLLPKRSSLFKILSIYLFPYLLFFVINPAALISTFPFFICCSK